jgi:DNA-binding transcriptional LysR family regulator
MDIKWIKSFVVLAQELHFGRAASRLNMVQPALTYQIRQLEESLGVRLLERSTRTVSLTGPGAVFLVEARQVLQHIDLAAQVAKDAAAGHAGELKVGFVDNAVWSVFTSVVREFMTRYPKVDIVLKQMNRTALMDELVDGRLDLAVLPGPVKGTGLISRVLTQAPLDVALPRHHPLCARHSVPIALLANEKFVTFPSAVDPRRIDEIVVAICAAEGFTPIFGQSVQQMHTALALVSTGFGVAIVPHWMRCAWEKNVEYRPLTPATPYVLMLTSLENRDRPVVNSFRQVAETYIQTHGDDFGDVRN